MHFFDVQLKFSSSVFPLEVCINFYLFSHMRAKWPLDLFFHNFVPWSCSMNNNDDSPRYQFSPSTCLFFPPSSKYSPQDCPVNNLNISFSVRNKMTSLYIKLKIIISLLIWSASLYGKKADRYLKWIQVNKAETN